MIQQERVKFLNDRDAIKGEYVLYWMQSSQRTEFNHALEYSIQKANELSQPIITYVGITEEYPEANQRHFQFILEGLQDVASSLEERGIQLVVLHKSPEIGAIELSKNASIVVVDRGYLRNIVEWRKQVARSIKCTLIQVESNVVVPVEEASSKEEYTAATLRPKIGRNLRHNLVALEERKPKAQSRHLEFDSLNLTSPQKVLSSLKIDRSVNKSTRFHGGTREAKRHLQDFLQNKLSKFHEFRNDPSADYLSNMSPYLHFGHISPLYIAIRVSQLGDHGREAFLEELVVRRELSINYTEYSSQYDSLEGLADWAKSTLGKHSNDHREYTYSREEFENARTHDSYWNAAQKEMTRIGKMHGYMRMYWGKKIIEWTNSPSEAFEIALYLNNKYELDGRDPNGFTGIAWCFGKHDRPWKERPIFGKVRYMSAEGLERKFDMNTYIKRVEGETG